MTDLVSMAHLGAGIAIGFGAVGAGLGIGFATKGLMDAVSRQPEVAGKAFGFFLLGAAGLGGWHQHGKHAA